MKTFVIFLAVLAAPLTAHAQHVNVGALDEDSNVVTLTTGAEHGLMLGVGYARVQRIVDRRVVLGGNLTMPWAEADLADYRVRAGALVPIVGRARWQVLGGLTMTVRGTRNDLARMTNVGTDVVVLAGRYAPRGFVAAELGFDWLMATHVAHADAYRMVYDGAQDGWYGNAGGMFRAGLQAGLSLGRHDVILRVGRLADITGAPAQFPYYGTLSFDTRW